MDDPTAQIAEQILPELIRSMLEHMRGLRLRGPPTFQHEHYADVWQALAAVGNYLVDRIEDLRFKGHEQWENGDEASVQQFGRLSVPQGKDFLRTVLRELASLGTELHVTSARAGIDTQRFDPNLVPRFVEIEAPNESIKLEDEETDDVRMEDAKKQAIEPKATNSEDVEPLPPGSVLPSIETTSSFKTPTTPRPADYKTPPRGPSFSHVTPPPQAIAETNSNSHNNNNPIPIPPHPPLQYPNDQRFQTYLSSINFTNNDNHDPHSMFNSRTPTAVQEKAFPLPQLASQAPDPTTSAALAERVHGQGQTRCGEYHGVRVFNAA